MNEKLTSNNNEDNDFLNTDEVEYKHLINRLKEISRTIAFLEKTIFR